MEIAIIDYNAGNVQSVIYALERLGCKARLTAEAEVIQKADKVIFPGVGEANTTMDYLKSSKLDGLIRGLKQPVLGICLGMQLLCEYSEENDTPCLGIIPQRVVRFQPKHGEKVPHMGWNVLAGLKGGLFSGTGQGEYAYFVHSYYVEKGPYTIATTDYIQPFSSALQKDNFYATQFHPEKSGAVGGAILNAFINL
jgi:glutamine amidotransferase